MGLRDILITAIVFGSIPYIFSRPYIGVLVWSWLGYMNPHRLTWGFAYSMPFAQIVAVVTLMSVLFSKQKTERIPVNSVTVFWGLLLVWMLITTIFASRPDLSWAGFSIAMKIQLFTFVTILLIRSRKELELLIWVIVLSIGYYSVKGGVFTLKTAGAFRVWGPPGSYIEDNNALAVASIMLLPLMYFLWQNARHQWLRYALIGMMLLTIISAIGSYSRSALLASLATGFFLWLKTPGKLVSGFALLIVAVLVFNFMPQAWHDRMDTIINYQEEGSAMGRIHAWEMASNLANQEIMGAGFRFWGPDFYRLYHEDPITWHANRSAHSIYFTMVGEHGWIGLVLFLLIFFSAWRLAGRTIAACRGDPELKWIENLCKLLQVSLVAYASGGAFLNLAYFDLPWHILAMIVITSRMVESAEPVTRNYAASLERASH